MFASALKFFRDQPKGTAVLLAVIYLICFGGEGAAYALAVAAFLFLYFWIITSGDDDDLFGPPPGGPWRMA
jgi:hypothetical protein